MKIAQPKGIEVCDYSTQLKLRKNMSNCILLTKCLSKKRYKTITNFPILSLIVRLSVISTYITACNNLPT